MRNISATILVYPYPWYSERLVHKDVYQFPDAIARALKNEMKVLKGWLITGQERDGQSMIVLRAALLLNVLLLLLRLPILRLSSKARTPCFVFFHISWPTALLACAVRFIWGEHARVVIKTDLNPNSELSTSNGGSMLERLSVRTLRTTTDLFSTETLAAVKALHRLFDHRQVILCRNGIDLFSISHIDSASRNIDVLVVSRFFVEKKGAALYKEVIPQLVNAGLDVHLIGEGAEEFAMSTALKGNARLIVSEQLKHADVLRAMRQARVFLSLSLSESFLIAIMEAYAMGCRVISTAVGVAPDLAKETSSIIIVPFNAENIVPQVLQAIGQDQPLAPSRLGGWDDVVEDSGLVQRLTL
jgi:glycosyltransferase involved in cell wall biosynthesis